MQQKPKSSYPKNSEKSDTIEPLFKLFSPIINFHTINQIGKLLNYSENHFLQLSEKDA